MDGDGLTSSETASSSDAEEDVVPVGVVVATVGVDVFVNVSGVVVVIVSGVVVVVVVVVRSGSLSELVFRDLGSADTSTKIRGIMSFQWA